MIGREEERKALLGLLKAEESQFTAVFGRRRVGKTYLIRETFGGKFAFQYTGVMKASLQQQLATFYMAMQQQGLKAESSPTTWLEAFDMLRRLLETKKGKKIVFLDELPWMDSPRSGFVTALGHFWNSWAAWTHDIVLVVCGSATSWIISKIVKDRGGLHNRLTHRIYLQPFTLHECEQYCREHRLSLSRMQIAEAYMVFGGVPYYWSLLRRDLGLTQNIDRLCFDSSGELAQEFDHLYASLFKAPADYIRIVRTLSGKKAGMTREELIEKSGLSNNGKLSEELQNLDYCGFVRTYYPFGKRERGTVYQLIDNFTLFYFQFINGQRGTDTRQWSSICGTTKHNTWAGLAFERLCLQHKPQLLNALGIAGIGVATHSWVTKAAHSACDEGAQIDLLLVRADRTIDICEMKYSTAEYHVTRQVAEKTRAVVENFRLTTGTRHALRKVLLTPVGVYDNEYRWEFDNVVTLDDLFKA